MIRISHVEVYGFGHALRNMRNPKESWVKNDSDITGPRLNSDWRELGFNVPEMPFIGANDATLIQALTKAGRPHRKVLRTIGIWMDIVPWRGMWQEIDTYKIATVRNSCSTMHKLGYRDLIPADFQDADVELDYLEKLNELGRQYRETSCTNKKLLMKIKHRLPEGYLQLAGYHFNYETALNIFFQRMNHGVPEWRWTDLAPDPTAAKAGEWRSLCDLLYSLPYMSTLISCDRRWSNPEE